MVTVKERLTWWRKKSYYLGDEVSASIINRITYDENDNEIKSTSVVVDLKIYTRSGNSAIERIERWIVPDANSTNYLTKPAYKRNYTITNRVQNVFWFGRPHIGWWW